MSRGIMLTCFEDQCLRILYYNRLQEFQMPFPMTRMIVLNSRTWNRTKIVLSFNSFLEESFVSFPILNIAVQKIVITTLEFVDGSNSKY